MRNLKSPGKPRPTKELRDQARRDEIVAAARKCALERGFHGSGMASIAEEAGMSVGQIYRYFDNKEAIIRAIVEQIVDQRAQRIAEVHESNSVARIAQQAMLSLDEEVRENSILMLEIAAEATRNRAVLQIVQESDLRLRRYAADTFMQQEPGLSEEDALARSELMAALLTGTAQLRVLGLSNDAQSTRQLYQRILETALSWKS